MITDAVQGWLDDPASNNGVILVPAPGSNVEKYFHSSDASVSGLHPELKIVWTHALGGAPFWQYEEFPLSHGRDLAVNVANGNAVFSTVDVAVGGVAGHGVELAHSVNSLQSGSTSFGPGIDGSAQAFSLHPKFGPDGRSHVDVVQPDGRHITFLLNPDGSYSSTSRTDTVLSWNPNGAGSGDDRFEMRANTSGTTWRFYAYGPIDDIVDRNSNLIDYRYTTGGQLDEVVDTRNRVFDVGFESGPAATAKVTQITDPAGRTVTYGYDTSGRLKTVNDIGNNVTTYTWDSSNRITKIAEPTNRSTLIVYNTSGTYAGRVASVTRVDNNGAQTGPTTSFAYAQNCSTIATGYDPVECTVVTNPRNNRTVFYVDAQGRVTDTEDAVGITRNNEYDSDSNVIAFTSSDGTASSVVSSTYTGTNLTSTALPTGASSNLAYSDTDNTFAPSQVTSAQGNDTSYDYDTNGRLDTATDSNPACGSGCTLDIDYNTDGTIDRLVAPNGVITSYTWTSTTSPVATTIVEDRPAPLGDVTTVLDALDRVASVTDGNNRTTTYTYDNYDQTITVTKDGATSATITTGYDPVGNRTTQTGPSGTVTTVWDLLNRIDTETRGSTTIDYAFDKNNNLASVVDQNGTTNYAYNQIDLLTSITHGTMVLTYTPNNYRRSTAKITLPNSWFVDHDYDDSGRPQAITVQSGPSSIALSRTYTYGNGGSAAPADDRTLLQTETDENNQTTSYTYDAIDRLTDAVSTNSSSTVIDTWGYTSDAVSNLTSITHNADTEWRRFNDANQLCWTKTVYTQPTNTCTSTPAAGVGYTYDTGGNLTGDSNGRSNTYNTFNQATAQTGPTGTNTNTHTELPPVGRSRWLRGRGGLGWIVGLLPSNGSDVAERRVAAA